VLLGWGSTFGSIKTAAKELRDEGHEVSHIHLRYLNPLPKNLEFLLKGFDYVLVPELNNGQLVSIIRDRFLIDAKGINKIQGRPFGVQELKDHVINHLDLQTT